MCLSFNSKIIITVKLASYRSNPAFSSLHQHNWTSLAFIRVHVFYSCKSYNPIYCYLINIANIKHADIRKTRVEYSIIWVALYVLIKQSLIFGNEKKTRLINDGAVCIMIKICDAGATGIRWYTVDLTNIQQEH